MKSGAGWAGALVIAAIVSCVGDDPDATPFEGTGSSSSSSSTSSSGATSSSGGASSSSSSGDAGPTAGPFKLTLAPTAITLPKTGSGTVAVAIERDAGFTEPVTIAVTDLPSNVAFDPLTVDDASGILTFHTTGAAPTTVKVTVTGASAKGEQSTKLDVSVSGAPGEPDRAFGTNEQFTFEPPDTDSFTPAAVLVQTDGKIVVGGTRKLGSQNYFSLFRLETDGTLDPSFGTVGFTALEDLERGQLAQLTFQSNGSIIAAGTNTDSPTSAKLIRFGADGKADPTFGSGGVALAKTGLPGFDPGITTTDVVVAKNDHLYAIGSFDSYDGADNGVIAHFDPNGVLDTTYATAVTDHLAMYSFQETPGTYYDTHFNAAVVQANGSVIAGGWTNSGTQSKTFFRVFLPDGTDSPNGIVASSQRFSSTFGVTRAIHAKGSDSVVAIADKIESSERHLAVITLEQSGADSAVNVHSLSKDDRPVDIAATADGGYVILTSLPVASGAARQPVVLRLLGPSVKDVKFGKDGSAEVFDAGAEATAIAVAPDGRIVVVAGVTTTSPAKTKAVVRRLWP